MTQIVVGAAVVIVLLALGLMRAAYVIGYTRGRKREQEAMNLVRAAVNGAAPRSRTHSAG